MKGNRTETTISTKQNDGQPSCHSASNFPLFFWYLLDDQPTFVRAMHLLTAGDDDDGDNVQVQQQESPRLLGLPA